MTASRSRFLIEQKAIRGKLWVASGMAQFVRRMWEHFTINNAETKQLRKKYSIGSTFFKKKMKDRRQEVHMRRRLPKVREILWKIGKWFFFLIVIGQSLVGGFSASENAQFRGRQLVGMHGETKVNARSWVQMNQTSFGREEGKKEMQKESRMALSIEHKYMRRYKEMFSIFFGVEHRMRKEEMEEQFNEETKQG